MLTELALAAISAGTVKFLIWAAAAVIGIGILFWIVSGIVASSIVYKIIFVKVDKDKWGRAPSSSDADQIEMYDEGMLWAEENKEFMKPVSISNDGLKLCGEFYDFGFDKAVIFLPGRSESLHYGYYFVSMYRECGFNVLLIDPRAHGWSEGKYNTMGWSEGSDNAVWVNFARNELKMKTVIFHGICVGASGGFMALKNGCEVDGFIADGLYTTFNESFKNHIKERKKPVYPTVTFINMRLLFTQHRTMHFGPVDVIDKFDKPLLMLHSKEDIYSVPKKAQKLYDLCPSEKKKLIWWEHGAHSHLRYVDKVKYDEAIKAFLKENY